MQNANPKQDPDRLAMALYYPTGMPPVFSGLMRDMCDRPGDRLNMGVVTRARIYKHLYVRTDEEGVLRLVDEWDMGPGARTRAVGMVYCTAGALLTWADATAIRGDLIHKGSLELHEHVKRMDAYMKERIELLNTSHEFRMAE